MSNSLITLAILTLSGGAFAAAFMSDPCASPCGSADTTVSASEVWSGGSDTGGCIPEMGRRRPIGSCTETECSINEVAYKDDDDNCKIIDDLPCEPEKPVIAPRESTTSVAIMDEDELQDRRSGCIPVHRPPPPQFTLACYRDGRDEPGSGWGTDRDYPWNDHNGCYDACGNHRDPDDFGPCFDRWGRLTGDMQTPYGII